MLSLSNLAATRRYPKTPADTLLAIEELPTENYDVRWMSFVLLWLAAADYSLAHGGRTNAAGCHNDRKNGGSHCHNGRGRSAIPPRSSSPSSGSVVRARVVPEVEEAKAEGRVFSYIYRREDWNHWIDADSDCMNTRHEVLLEQADGPVQLSPDGCYVSTGRWEDPFSGKIFSRTSELDVDHIVPLKWANGHGGDKWSSNMKEKFANDSRNLLVVHDQINQKKGAKGPDEWLPPNQEYRCEYLARWQKVLSVYPDLKLTPLEGRVINRQVAACAK